MSRTDISRTPYIQPRGTQLFRLTPRIVRNVGPGRLTSCSPMSQLVPGAALPGHQLLSHRCTVIGSPQRPSLEAPAVRPDRRYLVVPRKDAKAEPSDIDRGDGLQNELMHKTVDASQCSPERSTSSTHLDCSVDPSL